MPRRDSGECGMLEMTGKVSERLQNQKTGGLEGESESREYPETEPRYCVFEDILNWEHWLQYLYVRASA
jgi:hypothetical protein